VSEFWSFLAVINTAERWRAEMRFEMDALMRLTGANIDDEAQRTSHLKSRGRLKQAFIDIIYRREREED
jgi:hypothetical protein